MIAALITCRGGRFFKAFFLFTLSLALSAVIGVLALTAIPTNAYAEEVTGEAATDVYLVKTDDGATATTTTTTITNPSTTTKTGDSTPFAAVVAGIGLAAVASVVAARKLVTIGGDNL